MRANSNIYYNQLDLNNKSLKVSSYLNTVNRLVELHSKKPVEDYLDVGCGDGQRTQGLLEALQPSRSTLIDPSKSMITLARSRSIAPCIQTSILEFDTTDRYDVITCLWNVLGHLDTPDERVAALRKMRSLLKEDGYLFIDFNNRYNIKNYGLYAVALNFVKDVFCVSSRGWYPLDSVSSVYIHSFYESYRLLKRSGLRIEHDHHIDYESGTPVTSPWFGQSFFVVTKDA